MKKLLFRLPILLIPALFAYLGIFYQDGLYFGIAAISFLISLLIIFPSLLASSLKIPKLKKITFNIKKDKVSREKPDIKTLIFSKYLKTSLILLTIFTLLFTYVSIFKLTNIDNNNNVLISYFINQFHFVSTLIIYAAIGILLIALIILKINLSDKKMKLKVIIREGLISIGMTFVSLFLGICIALIISGIAGFIQLNAVSINFRLNPQHNGLITDTKKIIDNLKSMDKAPAIIPYTTKDQYKLLISLANPNQSSNSFYLKSIVSHIPSLLILPLQLPDKSVFMLKNMIVVRSINPSEIEPLSPYIGYLLVKSYFNGRFIKSYPSVKVMGRQEYLDYRISQYDKIISKLNTYIQSIEDEISGYYGRINSDKNKIASWQDYISTAESNKSSAYSNCMSSGYYSFFTGSFINTNSQSYCQSVASDYDTYVNQANQYISTLNKDVNSTYYYISQDKDAEDVAKSYISSLENAKSQTPQELGVFEADTGIKLAVDETSSNVVVDYFSTLAHEYLHYASYVNKDQVLTYSFFEEGLTETFARKVTKNEFSINTHMGYPVLAAIMKEIMKKIPEKTLADIYFTKDESRLEAELANSYGEKFYGDFSKYFDILGYLPARDALSLANSMLLRMGSKSIKESDLYSSADTPN
jgi:hypothetical protein